jgi:hypothetical protein
MGPRVPLTALAVLLAAVLAHAGSLRGGFVYDDHRFVEQNEAIRSLSALPRFFTDPSTASAGAGIEPDVWRPLRTANFAVDRALFGLEPAGWHLGNVALHGVNALLVWVLLLRVLGGSVPGAAGRLRRGGGAAADAGSGARSLAAAAGAVLFAVHPVTSEAVAWVSSRGDLLAWTFVLLALEVLARPGARRTVVGAALVAAACLAKESAIVAFALLPLRDRALVGPGTPSPRETWARTGVLAGVSALYLLARAAVLPGADDLPFLAQTEFPDGGRAAAARAMLASVAWYARVLVWPVGFPFDRNLHVDPVPSSWGDPAVVLGAGIVATLLLAGAAAWARGKGTGPGAFAWLGALVVLVPVSNVIVPLKAFAAERFLYPALPCLAAGAAAAGLALARRARARPRRVVGVATLAVLALLGVLAAGRDRAWADERTLWTAVLSENPMNPRAHEGLGFEWLEEGEWAKAEKAFRTYREFQPLDGKVQAELAAVFWGAYRRLVEAEPGIAEGWSVRPRQKFVLEQTLRATRAALDAWTRAGLTRGRGSEDLVRRTLVLQRAAALEYGDLLEAQRANQMLWADDLRTRGAPAYAQVRAIPLLASRALTQEGERADPERSVDLRRRRRDLLEAARVDPGLPDAEAMAVLVGRLEELLATHPDDDELRREAFELLRRVAWARRGTGAWRPLLERGREHLRVLEARRPDDPWVAAQRDGLERALAEGR